MTTLSIQTPDGKFFATYSEAGLRALDFPGRDRRESASPSAQIARWHKTTTQALISVLEGSEAKQLPPLDLGGTDFQRAVWNALREIRAGNTSSYGEIARRLGKKSGAARAVGGACGANPIPVLIPCHRVLAAGGSLGGFSGGLDWKKKLLAREGVAFR